jgi:hypothetical protein
MTILIHPTLAQMDPTPEVLDRAHDILAELKETDPRLQAPHPFEGVDDIRAAYDVSNAGREWERNHEAANAELWERALDQAQREAVTNDAAA